ncbi:MAG: hypothetical protein QXF77_05865, partial [Candidatus Jordarchaeales archaeon]
MNAEKEMKRILEGLVEGAGIRGAILTTKEGFSRMSAGEVDENVAPVIASLSSMSSQVLHGFAKKELDYVLTRSKATVVISVPVGTRMNLAVFVDRDAVELEGIETVVSRVKATSIQLAAIDEVTSYEEGSVLYMVKKEVPEAFMAAVLTIEGMPLDVYPSLDYVTSAGVLSAVSMVCDKIVKEDENEYSVIVGGDAIIIVYKLPQSRVLAVG